MKANTTTYAPTVGDRVTCNMPAFGDENMIGTVEAMTGTGWIKVRLDNPPEVVGVKDGCISCRVRSLSPLSEEGDEEADDESNMLECSDYDSATSPDDVEEAMEEAETAAHRMAEALRKARAHYIKARRPNGAATANNGDQIAKALHDLEPKETAEMADKCLGLPIGTHLAKYGHLNNGQIRMNSGNRIRGAFAKALRDKDADTISRIVTILDLDVPEDLVEEDADSE